MKYVSMFSFHLKQVNNWLNRSSRNVPLRPISFTHLRKISSFCIPCFSCNWIHIMSSSMDYEKERGSWGCTDSSSVNFRKASPLLLDGFQVFLTKTSLLLLLFLVFINLVITRLWRCLGHLGWSAICVRWKKYFTGSIGVHLVRML